MSVPLLSTKLFTPQVRRRLVPRPRLVERLNQGLDLPLILVSASAGYGKTTLLSTWLKQCPYSAAWLALDERDNDLACFLIYLVAALQKIQAEIGTPILAMLQSAQALQVDLLLSTLINEITQLKDHFVLVLDDYQVIQEPPVHQAVSFLLAHLPRQMHLVISTRADPPLHLAQLRARGQLLELRAAELCFTPDDSQPFFKEIMGLALSASEIAALVQKTEGWAAGLQIAALVLQDQPDLPRAVQTFAGSHRHVLDFLAIEVIERLPESTQDFLYQTAILDDLEASLCDAVTGRNDSQQILEQLDRENQFIVRLDEERRWYRYHRLMAEALRRRAEDLDREQFAELHRRASAWYAERGMVAAALEHAFQANDLGRAAELIEAGAEAILKGSQVVTLLNWLNRLPEEMLRERPRLNSAYAWALLLKGGSTQAVLERLGTSAAQAADPMAAGEEAVIRALVATLTGDVRQAFAYSHRALEVLPAGSTFLRSIAADNLGMAYVTQGDIPAAIQAFKVSSALAQDSGNLLIAVASLSNLGGLYLLQGHLKLAEAVYHQALELATTQFGQRLPVACRALLGLGEIAREWNHLEKARELLEEGVQLSQQYNETGELVMVLTLARVFQTVGEEKKALDLVQKAQAIAIQSTSSAIDDRVVEVSLARLWLQQGNLTGAVAWAASRGFEQDLSSPALPESDTRVLPYDLREAERLVYARLQLAQGHFAAALDTLTVLLREAEKQGRFRRLHEILVLLALAYWETGAADLAVNTLERSLKAAAPEGYTRVYLDEGPALVKLLREAARRGIQRQYCSRLLNAFQTGERTPERVSDAGFAGLEEPLSERELEVLKLLAEGCPNREIAERLYISLSTVKGHISNINGKLLARNRTEAVARARQMGLLPGD